MKKINLIIVGLGNFGKKRLSACLDLATHCTVIGLVDADKAKAQTIARSHSLPFATNLKAFKQQPVDAVIISTPNQTHAALAVQAMKFGWHVLCEKPLAINPVEAKKIVEASDRYKRFVKTGSNHRFFPMVLKAAALVKRGVIGEVLSFRGSIGTNGSQTQDSWFWNPSVSGGGTFIDNGCHLLDIARMFMGDFVECLGHATSVYWNQTEVDDLGTGIFVTAQGRQAVITSSWTQWGGYLYFELWGQDGYIIVDTRHGDILTMGKRENRMIKIYDYSQTKKDSYHQELLYFRRCILADKNPEPNANDGRKVIQMIHGIYQSTKSKRWITL